MRPRAFQASLDDDHVLTKFVIHAFSRENSCESDEAYHNPRANCDVCSSYGELGNICELDIESTPEDPRHSIRETLKTWATQSMHRDGETEASRKGECTHAKHCWMAISEKRKLQNQILAAPWFSLRHALAIEKQCKVCPDAMHEAYNEICRLLPFDPLAGCDFDRSPLKQFHRRHLVHGVELPARLLCGSISEEETKLLKKLIEWSVDEQWHETSCWKVRENVMKKAKEAIRDAIKGENIDLIFLLADEPERVGCLGYPVRWDLLKLAVVDLQSSNAMVDTLLDAFDWDSEDFYPDSMDSLLDPDYLAVMAATKERKGRNQGPNEELPVYLQGGDVDRETHFKRWCENFDRQKKA